MARSNRAEREVNPIPNNGLEGEAAVEYLRNNSPTQATVTEEDVTHLATTNSEMLALLNQAEGASEEQFKKNESDFFKPTEADVGTARAKMKGVYLGRTKTARYYVHAFLTRGSEGQPMVKRVNGTTILTKELKQIALKTMVMIEYKGEDKTMDGNALALWDVAVLK